MCFSLVLQFFADFSWIAKFYLNLKMSEGGYKIRNPSVIHFITFSVVEWVDVFTRKTYCDIVLDSIRFCQVEKGLALHAWCLMSNHLHLIASAKNENLSDILRDFKKFTSTQIIEAIINNKQESRKDRMLRIFKEEGTKNLFRMRQAKKSYLDRLIPLPNYHSDN